MTAAAKGVDPVKEELYSALMKSTLDLQTEKLTKTFEERERDLRQQLGQASKDISIKTHEVAMLQEKLRLKETDMAE